jgi:hypothetical protein
MEEQFIFFGSTRWEMKEKKNRAINKYPTKNIFAKLLRKVNNWGKKKKKLKIFYELIEN